MEHTLEFEKPVKDLENRIKELKQSADLDVDLSKEIKALEKKVARLIKSTYADLSIWERVQLARHPDRPHAIDYISNILTDFHEIHGDRRFSEDSSIIAGLGYMDGKKVAVLGIEKGRKTQEKIDRNFGMASPEGYRKSLRLMELAERFQIPLVCFVDTPGAYPGIEAEERGQAQAIAENLQKMISLKTPTVAVVIGEGGSGGALAIAVADKVLMQEYAIYSVISPESCASILWSDSSKAQRAAESLKLHALKAKELGVIDGIVSEPAIGAHGDKELTYNLLKESLLKHLNSLDRLSHKKLVSNRINKFRSIGLNYIEGLDN